MVFGNLICPIDFIVEYNLQDVTVLCQNQQNSDNADIISVI